MNAWENDTNNLQLFSYSARHANIVRNSYLEGRGVAQCVCSPGSGGVIVSDIRNGVVD